MFDLVPHLPRARPLPDLTPEVAYSVRPSFFYGSFGKPKPNDMREQAAALVNPGFVRKQRALSLQVERQEAAMVRYYADVLRLMQQHRQQLLHCRQYFAVQPLLLSGGKAVVTFPVHETYPAAAGLLRALQAPGPDGVLYDDLDQGWQVAIYARGDRVYVGEGSDDDSKPRGLYYTDRARLAQLAGAALTRLQRQVAYFVREVGQNLWAYPIGEEGKGAGG